MRDPELFDTFYKDARERLLLQTYALTGDLAASRAAVRDSFVVAWHHWRKVSRLDDPEESVRPHAWRHAQRRHTARLWHREKGIDPEVKATLDALAKLPVTQRRALLLTQLASVSMPQMAREIGLPLEDAERELSSGAAQFSLLRGVSGPEIRAQFAPLADMVADARWPRATIIRRAGAARRRTHTVVGVAISVAALFVSGSLVTDAAGVRPSLDRASQTQDAPTDGSIQPDEPPSLVPAVMVGQSELRDATRRDWTVTSTGSSPTDDGLVMPCQQEPYADADGIAGLVRTFQAAPARGRPSMEAVQVTEISATVPAARRAFTTALGWYAGCPVERTQLLSTRRVQSVGDQAMQIVLRAWEKPLTTITVGVARTGRFTTTTMTMAADDAKPDVEGSARLLGSAVSALCTLPEAEGGECSGTPRLHLVAPLPVGKAPAMLTELDLPPVSGVAEPWVGTEPRRASTNLAATRCDNASFSGAYKKAKFTANMTRSFLIPGADLPVEFGLTESVATLPGQRAAAFVGDVRQSLNSCEDEDDGLGTEVEQIANRDDGRISLTAWTLTVDVTDERSVRYAMAIMRRGTAVAQVAFVPTGRVDMGDTAFVDLAYRALDRLVEMPDPGGSP